MFPKSGPHKALKLIAVVAVSLMFLSSAASLRVFAISNISINPSTDLVNSSSYYNVLFTTGIKSPLTQVSVTFPTGFNVAGASLVSVLGLNSNGVVSVSGQTISYTFKNSSVSANTKVALTFGHIKNPSGAGSFTTAVIKTLNGAKLEESGTAPAFTIRQLTGADISSSSSLTIAALTTGTLTVSGAATFKSTVSTAGLLAAHGGIATTTIAATGAATFASTVTTTGLLTANGGISVPAGKASTLSGTLSVGGLLTANGGVTVPNGQAVTLQGSSYLNVGGFLQVGGELYVAGGAFQVSSSGQIVTGSVTEQSFAPGALPVIYATCTVLTPCTTTTTTGTIGPLARNYMAIVTASATIDDTSGSASTPGWAISTSGWTTTPTLQTDSEFWTALPANSVGTSSFVFIFTGLNAGDSGTFSISISGTPPTSYFIFNLDLVVQLIPE